MTECAGKRESYVTSHGSQSDLQHSCHMPLLRSKSRVVLCGSGFGAHPSSPARPRVTGPSENSSKSCAVTTSAPSLHGNDFRAASPTTWRGSHLDCRLLVSKTVTEEICAVSHPVCGHVLCSPKWLTPCTKDRCSDVVLKILNTLSTWRRGDVYLGLQQLTVSWDHPPVPWTSPTALPQRLPRSRKLAG